MKNLLRRLLKKIDECLLNLSDIIAAVEITVMLYWLLEILWLLAWWFMR